MLAYCDNFVQGDWINSDQIPIDWNPNYWIANLGICLLFITSRNSVIYNYFGLSHFEFSHWDDCLLWQFWMLWLYYYQPNPNWLNSQILNPDNWAPFYYQWDFSHLHNQFGFSHFDFNLWGICQSGFSLCVQLLFKIIFLLLTEAFPTHRQTHSSRHYGHFQQICVLFEIQFTITEV